MVFKPRVAINLNNLPKSKGTPRATMPHAYHEAFEMQREGAGKAVFPNEAGKMRLPRRKRC